MPAEVPTHEEFEALALKVANLESVQGRMAVQLANLTPPAPTVSAPPQRKVVFFDDFTGRDMDTTKWNVRNNSWASNEESIVTSRPANVAHGESSVILRAQKENYTTPGGGATRKYTSAYFDSKGKASWLYGRFEMRAKLPAHPGRSKGLWPAFWLRPDDGKNGEIDIMESIGSGSTREVDRIHTTIHHDYNTGADHIPHQGDHYTLTSSTTDWHVYALEWTADALVWQVDGIEIFRRDTKTTPWFAEVFRKKYHFRVNLQVGGTWAGSPDEYTVFPGDYEIDYIKVYAPKGTS